MSARMREHYERQLKALHEAYGEAMLEIRARKSCPPPCWARTRADALDPARLEGRGYLHTNDKMCQWFGMARRSMYYLSTQKCPTADLSLLIRPRH